MAFCPHYLQLFPSILRYKSTLHVSDELDSSLSSVYCYKSWKCHTTVYSVRARAYLQSFKSTGLTFVVSQLLKWSSFLWEWTSSLIHSDPASHSYYWLYSLSRRQQQGKPNRRGSRSEESFEVNGCLVQNSNSKSTAAVNMILGFAHRTAYLPPFFLVFFPLQKRGTERVLTHSIEC